MEQGKVQYMTPEQVRSLDPSLIDYMTMSSGSIIKVGKQQKSCEFQEEKVCPKQIVPVICRHCGKYKLPSNTFQNNRVVLRGGKKGANEAEKGEENVENQNEVEIVGQPEGEQQEVLRGPDGKPLLSDILAGGDYYGEGEVQQEQQYTDDQQYVPEGGENANNQGYGEEYYDPNYQYGLQDEYDNLEDAIGYEQNENVVDPGVPEQNVEAEIPNENYAQDYLPDTNDAQVDDQNYPQELPQNQENVPEQTQPYAPIEEPENVVPEESPKQPEQQQPAQQSIQPAQQPIQPAQLPSQGPMRPINQPVQPNKKPIKPPVKPQPQQKPIPSQVRPLPNQRPMQPRPNLIPPQPKKPPVVYPKGVIPPKVVPPRIPPRVIPPGQQKKLIPSQPPRVVMPPGQQKKLVPSQPPRVVMPPGQQKKLVPSQPPRVVMPSGQQKKLVPQRPQFVPKGPVAPKIIPPSVKGFRSRPNNLNEDEENNEKPLLCPDCARAEAEEEAKEKQKENDTNNYREKQPYQSRTNIPRGKPENKYNSKTYQKPKSDFNQDHYKYHEINDTTDDSKRTGFIVKKAGIVISSNLDL